MPASTNIQNRQVRGGDLEPVAIARVLEDIPVTFTGGIDANIQVGGADVSAANPVPVDVVSTVTAIMGLPAHVNAPAADTAAVVTLAAAGVGVQNVLKSIHWGYDAAPVAATTLIVEDGIGTTIFTTYITAGGPGFEPFEGGRAGSPNTAMVVTLSTGGAGVSGSLTLHAGTQ